MATEQQLPANLDWWRGKVDQQLGFIEQRILELSTGMKSLVTEIKEDRMITNRDFGHRINVLEQVTAQANPIETHKELENRITQLEGRWTRVLVGAGALSVVVGIVTNIVANLLPLWFSKGG